MAARLKVGPDGSYSLVLAREVGESRVSSATFYNILSGVFPVDRRMVGIVLKHGYVLHI